MGIDHLILKPISSRLICKIFLSAADAVITPYRKTTKAVYTPLAFI